MITGTATCSSLGGIALRLGRMSDKKVLEDKGRGSAIDPPQDSGSKRQWGILFSASPQPCLELQGKVGGRKSPDMFLVEKGILGNKKKYSESSFCYTYM